MKILSMKEGGCLYLAGHLIADVFSSDQRKATKIFAWLDLFLIQHPRLLQEFLIAQLFLTHPAHHPEPAHASIGKYVQPHMRKDVFAADLF
jgi:hypothetical protein